MMEQSTTVSTAIEKMNGIYFQVVYLLANRMKMMRNTEPAKNQSKKKQNRTEQKKKYPKTKN